MRKEHGERLQEPAGVDICSKTVFSIHDRAVDHMVSQGQNCVHKTCMMGVKPVKKLNMDGKQTHEVLSHLRSYWPLLDTGRVRNFSSEM